MNRLAKHSRIAGPAQPRSVRGPQTLSGVFHIALGALISLGGCVAEPDASPLEEPRAGAPLEIEAEAVLSVGVVAGDSLQEFDRVRGAVRSSLTAGSSFRSAEVMRSVFSRGEGEFVERLGGRGEGPGEFVDLSAAGPRGDTIEAFDGRAAAGDSFPAGRLRRSRPDHAWFAARPVLSPPDRWKRGWALGGVVSGGPGDRWTRSSCVPSLRPYRSITSVSSTRSAGIDSLHGGGLWWPGASVAPGSGRVRRNPSLPRRYSGAVDPPRALCRGSWTVRSPGSRPSPSRRRLSSTR